MTKKKKKQVFSTSQFYSDIEKLYIRNEEYHIFQWAKELNHVHLCITSKLNTEHENKDSFSFLKIRFITFSQEEQKQIEQMETILQTEVLNLLNDIKSKSITDDFKIPSDYRIYGAGNNNIIMPFIQTLEELSINPEQNKEKLNLLQYLALRLFLNADIDTDKFHDEIIKIFNIVAKDMNSFIIGCLISLKPFRNVVDITDAVKLATVDTDTVIPTENGGTMTIKLNTDDVAIFRLDMKGEIYKRPDGKIQFLPDDLVSEKSPIFVGNEIKAENLKEHTKYTAKLTNYTVKGKCFFCTNLIEEFIYQQAVLTIECLKKAISDNSELDKLSDINIPPDIFEALNFDINNCIITTISKRLKLHRTEQIIPYLKKIKNINLTRCTELFNMYDYRYYIMPFISNQKFGNSSETTTELAKELIQQTSPEIISAVYLNTSLRFDVKLNVWFQYANTAGKLPELIEKLKLISFWHGGCSKFMDAVITDNITTSEDSATLIQVAGYDASQDIVLLKQISEEEAKENIRKLADTL